MTELDETEPNTKLILGMSFRTLCAWILGVLLVACGVAVRVSPMTTHVRVLLATTFLFFLFTCVVYLFSVVGTRPAGFFPALFFLVLFVVWSVLGSKPPDTDALRDAYYKRLHAFIGTPYAWGGETDLGIDCSGLARAALWQAMTREGIKEFNPRLLGSNLWDFWWHDLSARDIDDGKYGYTKVIGHTTKLAGYDTSVLEVGDMAVISEVHMMVYYGKGQWIEASPDDHKVVVNTAPANSKRPWFNQPATLVRWRMLEAR